MTVKLPNGLVINLPVKKPSETLMARPALLRGWVRPAVDGASAFIGLKPGTAVAGRVLASMLLWHTIVPAPAPGERWRFTTPWGDAEGEDAEALARAVLKLAIAEAVRVGALSPEEIARNTPKGDNLAASPWWVAARMSRGKP